MEKITILILVLVFVLLTGCNKMNNSNSDSKPVTKAETSEVAVSLLIKSFIDNDKDLFLSLYTGSTLSFDGLREKFSNTNERDYSISFVKHDNNKQADRYEVIFSPTGKNPLPGDLLIKTNKDDGYYYFVGIISKSGF